MSIPSGQRPAWRNYAQYAFLLVAGQSIALIAAADMLRRYISAMFGESIAWKDALVLLPLLIVFIVLGVVTLTIMGYHPKSVGKAAVEMRIYLLVAAITSWWLIDSPLIGWSTWAVIAGAFSATFARLNKQQ
jgi:hypothetical protein